MKTLVRRLTNLSGFWRRAEDGVAAVEFALVLPVMLTMLLCTTEVTLGVDIDRKLAILSRSLADLTARATTITTTDMTNIFAASTAVMQPYSATSLNMVVSNMKVTKLPNNTYVAYAQWSCAKGPNVVPKLLTVAFTVPSGYQTDGLYYVMVETNTPYVPMFGRAITGTISLVENTPWPIRNTTAPTLSGSCPT